jgi:hypothetical protein
VLSRPERWFGRVAARAGAVIAGCLVATVQCSSMTMTKLSAQLTPLHQPVQKADRPSAPMANLAKAVAAIRAPPP